MTFDITRWPDKDPLENVVVEFDFTPDTASVTLPTISVSVRWFYGPTTLRVSGELYDICG